MKLTILNKEGKKVSEKETMLFEEPVREDIIAKVVEAEKLRQPWSPKFRAGMDRSASGNVSHRRHVWKSDRGRGLARIPKKTAWRRGTQFSWEGAIVPSVKGGRRAHPPKGAVNLKKINKKEFKKALLSALSYVSSVEEVKKKYSSLTGKKIEVELPLVVEKKVLNLKVKELAEVLEKILGDFYSVAVQKKSVRAGAGKRRGRKYKKNAGLLVVVGNEEDLKIKGVDVVKVRGLIVSDLASNGARLTIFSEKAIEELEKFVDGENNTKQDKKDETSKSKDSIPLAKSPDATKSNLIKDKTRGVSEGDNSSSDLEVNDINNKEKENA